MNLEHNLDLVHKMYEALNSQDLDKHDEYWSKDMIWHGPPGWGDILGREAFKYKLMEPFYKIFPDYHGFRFKDDKALGVADEFHVNNDTLPDLRNL